MTEKIKNGMANASSRPSSSKSEPRKTTSKNDDETVLLSGGNPQIAKGYGDAPVQKYIAAMPGWKHGGAAR